MRNKGITLVALVVSIIIMLILAGVTLNIALGENGLFKMTQQAAEKYKTAQREEESTMQEISDELQGLIGKGKNDKTPGVITGEGTKDKPFLIESIEDLVEFSNKVNSGATYENQIVKLAVNLDFKAEDSYADDKNKMEELTTGTGFTSIGNNNNKFRGTFDGQNRTISNLYIRGTENNKGLFGYVEKGTIKNLKIVNADIDCDAGNIGVLVGNIGGGTIENIKINNGTIKGNRGVGGITGSCYGNSTINNCTNSSNITAKGSLDSGDNQWHSAVGGIVGGLTSSRITNCHNEGQIDALIGKELGGIVGWSNGDSVIESCYNEGKVGNLIENCSLSSVGGIVGDLLNSKVLKCYNEEVINGLVSVGGIVGNAGWNSKAYIENCYNTGTITSMQGSIGGICNVSSTTGSEINNCYNTGLVIVTQATNSKIRKYSRNS